MKDILKLMIKREVENLLKIYTENDAYTEFVNYIKSIGNIYDYFSDEEINIFFSKPAEILSKTEVIKNEEGDITTSTEFTDFETFSLKELKDYGWLNNQSKRDNIINEKFYKEIVFPSIGDMPHDIKKEIELNSIHILGRCNNPENWQENIQGLVYGMVQSGKTASMISLMGLARASGYRIFIILSSDKESLRAQTQKRLNESFGLNHGGYSKFNTNKIRSLTLTRSDYSEVSKRITNGLDLWFDINDKSQSFIICIKKQKDNLQKLIEHIKDVKAECYPGGRLHNLSFETDFKTIILDDEADFASQDTTLDGGSMIHNRLCELRALLNQNCYVAYTATPQACIGANPEKLIGYPKDFIWLLEPYRQKNGETATYMGLEEFFEKFPNQLINRLSNDAWPFIKKDEGIRRGIYSPGTTELLNNGEILREEEAKHVLKLIDDSINRNLYCVDFKIAITDFLITCAIRWHRHYIKYKISDKYPNLAEIEEIELPNSKKTRYGIPPYPYHAMMFNLAYINTAQASIIVLVDLLWRDIINDWNETKVNKWKKETIFTNQFDKQVEKSMRFEMTIPDNIELEYFIAIAIEITQKQIHDNDKYIYLLNSKDEGETLQYDSKSKESRPKKAAIIVGGNMLSRGLTIENLSTSVFARSQVMSLGDTNLQMCRWFGHKKKSIDLQSVYMQQHCQELFQSISESDKELRSQFKYHIFNNIPNKCLLLSLFNSPLYQSTSPSKMRNSGRGEQSYSGITVDLFQHTLAEDFLKNNQLLENYIKNLKQNVKEEFCHQRAIVYRDVPANDFITLFLSMKFSDDALNISPKKYVQYIEKWNELNHIPLPKFNIAIFDKKENGTYRKRGRKIQGNKDEFNSLADFKQAASNFLAPFRGGKSDPESGNKYCGDFLVDFPEIYHNENYNEKNLRREKGSPILILFYKIDANYIGKFQGDEIMFEDGDDLYIKNPDNQPLITFSISTPIGGPVFETRINNGALQIVKANSADCEDFFENTRKKISI